MTLNKEAEIKKLEDTDDEIEVLKSSGDTTAIQNDKS